MPWDSNTQPAGLMPIGEQEIKAAPDPSMGELMGAAFQRETSIGSVATSIAEGPNNPSTPYDASFDPWSSVRGRGYDDFLSSFIGDNDFGDVAKTMRRIDKQRARAELIESGGAWGVVADLISQFADPINFVPVGGQAIRIGRLGERALTGALKVGAVAGGTGLAQEGVLQATQETRTAQESALNVAASMLIGGVLGGAVGAISGRDLDALSRGIMDETEQLADDMAANIPNSGGPLSAGSSVGAEQVARSLESESIARLGKIPEALRKTAPTLRTQTSPLLETRIFGQELAEQSLMTKGNLEGRPAPVAVESLIRQWQYPLYRGLTEADDLFVKYRTGRAAKTGDVARIAVGDVFGRRGDALSRDEFMERAGRAARREDADEIPEVAAAAKAFRDRIIDPMKDEAIRLGLLPEDVDPGTAASYLMRQYNYSKIGAERDKFANIITDWYESEQSYKAGVQGKVREISAEMERLRAELEEGKVKDTSRIAELEMAQARLRVDLEAQVVAWRGKSAAAAKGALKRRGAKEADRPEGAARLGEADRDVDAAVRRILNANTRLERQELSDIAYETISRILGTPAGRLPYDVKTPTPGFMRKDGFPDKKGTPLKSRVFMIPDDLIEDYLENDISRISRDYVRSMAPDLAMAESGWLDITAKLKEVDTAYTRLFREAKTDAERAKLEAHRKEDIEMLKAIWERLRGTFALPRDPNGLASRAFRIIRDLNYMRLLGGVTISSIPDAGRAVMQHGFTRVFRDGFVPMVKNWKQYRLSAEEVKMSGEGLDMVLDTRSMSIADVLDDFGRHSKFERGLQTATGKFGMVTAMAPWNASIKQFVGIISQTRSLQAIEALKKGTIDAAERTRLDQFGIGQDMAERIGREFESHGKKHGSLWWANTEEWGDIGAARAYRAALSKEINQVIVTPGQEKLLWFSTDLGRVLFQFKSFSFASMLRVTMAGLQRRDAAALNGAALMVGLGALAYYLKTPQDRLAPPDEIGTWVVEGIDRSGLTGWMFDLNNITEKMTRGAVGASRLVGAPMMSRYASRGVLESILGPTAGLVNDTAQIAGSAATGDWRESDTRAARRMIPLQNLIFLRNVFDQAEEGINNAMGVPMRNR